MKLEMLLNKIKELFHLLEGVTVLESHLTKNYFNIEFIVTNSRSRLLIVYLAEASNMKLNIWAAYDPCSEEAVENMEEAIHYSFYAKDDEDVDDQVNWLGAHLTWKMYACQFINSEQERKYCEVFGAQSRSA